MKPLVVDKHPYYWICIKTNIYKFIYLFYDSSVTDIEHAPNYCAFGLPQIHQEGWLFVFYLISTFVCYSIPKISFMQIVLF